MNTFSDTSPPRRVHVDYITQTNHTSETIDYKIWLLCLRFLSYKANLKIESVFDYGFQDASAIERIYCLIKFPRPNRGTIVNLLSDQILHQIFYKCLISLQESYSRLAWEIERVLNIWSFSHVIKAICLKYWTSFFRNKAARTTFPQRTSSFLLDFLDGHDSAQRVCVLGKFSSVRH